LVKDQWYNSRVSYKFSARSRPKFGYIPCAATEFGGKFGDLDNLTIKKQPMKKLFAILALVFSANMLVAAPAIDENSKKEKTELTEAQKERLAEIEARVDEIKAMDFSAMSKDEKKDVRMELKDMKEEAKRAGGGVYISVGAIIIILLILILVT
tara:strand:+ start:181792 stop:182253 length:462 start_codon:yes stop_codon:yes gene_type:complete